MKKKLTGIGLIVALLLLPVANRHFAGRATSTVDVEPVAAREIRAAILASGSLVYRDQAQLSPEVIGTVTQILVREGDRVEAGQVILTIDDEQLRAEVAQREAAVRMQRLRIEQRSLGLADQERQFGRYDELLHKGFAARSRHEEAALALDMAQVELRSSQESLRQAEAALQQGREQLSRTVIRAPTAGIVIAINIKVGETAVPSATGIAGSSLVTIADTNSILAEINVDEADIAAVRIGQPVSVLAAAFPNTPLQGSVESISLSPRRPEGSLLAGAAASARTYSVKVRLANRNGMVLRPGMTCRAEIFTATSRGALAVPVQAVLTNNREEVGGARPERDAGSAPPVESHVFVVNNNHVFKRAVRTGLSDDSYQQILGGLRPGEKVVVGPYEQLRFLSDGQTVSAGTIGAAAS